jgi:hypothetical protein
VTAALLVLAVQSAIGVVAAVGLNSYDSVFDLDRNNGIPDLLSTAVILAAALGATELASTLTPYAGRRPFSRFYYRWLRSATSCSKSRDGWTSWE